MKPKMLCQAVLEKYTDRHCQVELKSAHIPIFGLTQDQYENGGKRVADARSSLKLVLTGVKHRSVVFNSPTCTGTLPNVCIRCSIKQEQPCLLREGAGIHMFWPVSNEAGAS